MKYFLGVEKQSGRTQGRMGARKAALILMKNSHFDRLLQYAQFINWINYSGLNFCFNKYFFKGDILASKVGHIQDSITHLRFLPT